MKKILSILLILTLTMGVFAGCASDNTTEPKDETAQEKKEEAKDTDTKEEVKEPTTVKMFQFKVEIAEQLERMKEDLKAETGIDLEIETAGGGADYGAMLKAKFASGEYPDIFNNGGNTELDLWQEKLEDLSDQPWVEYMVPGTEAGMSKDGKMYGMPMNVEGYGFLYNVDLFEQAGIETLPTNLAELEDACKKLEAIGVTPFSSGYQEWWVLGIHNFNTFIANEADPLATIQGLKDGTLKLNDQPNFHNWVDMLDLTVKYGQKNTLTVDYNTQVTEFAIGKSAMMQQGNWTQVQVAELNPEINVGVLPMPVQSENNNKVYVGVPNYWVVHNQSEVKDAAKEVLNWIITSETGKAYTVNEFKFIPAFTNFDDLGDLGTIAQSLQGYMNEGNVLGWHWTNLPDGAVNEIGAYMQAYIGEAMTKDELMENIEKVINEFANK